MDHPLVILAEVLGGLALFIYGITLTGEGFRKTAGGFFRSLARLVARNRPAALLAGAGITLTVQSASATTALLVSLANAGLLRAWQVLGVILGGCLGGAIIVQAIAFRLDQYALFVVAAAIPVAVFSRFRRWRPLGITLLGVGFLFYGMHLLASGFGPLGQEEWLLAGLARCAANPLLALLAGLLLAALLQSSTAAAAIILALAQSGVLGTAGSLSGVPPEPVAVVTAALPFLLGAHAGSTVTAALAAAGASREAWRVVAAHALLRLPIAFLLLPFVGLIAGAATAAATWMGAGPARAVANAHTIYNVTNVVLFLPFIGLLGRLIERLVPVGRSSAARVARYLSEKMPPEAEAGLAEAAQELARLGEETVPLVGRVFGAFEGAHPGEVDLLRAQAARLEAVHEALVRYLSRLSALGLGEAEAQLQHRLLFLARDLRAVTDLAVGKLLDLVEEQEGGGTTFSIEGLSQLRKFHTELVHDLDRVVRSLRAPDPAAEGAVLAAEAELPEQSRQLVLAHFERMAAGVKEAIESDALFLRAQAVLAEAYGLLAGMVRTLQRGGPLPTAPRVPPTTAPPAAGA